MEIRSLSLLLADRNWTMNQTGLIGRQSLESDVQRWGGKGGVGERKMTYQMDSESDCSDAYTEATITVRSNVSRSDVKVELIEKGLDSLRVRNGRVQRLKGFVEKFMPKEQRRRGDSVGEDEFRRASEYATLRHRQVLKDAEMANKAAQMNEGRNASKIDNAVKLARRKSVLEKIENTRIMRDSDDIGKDMGRGGVVVPRERSQSPKYQRFHNSGLADTLLGEGGSEN